MSDYVKMGRNLRARRLTLGLSQKAAARAAGISAPFYGHIEHGVRKPSVDTLELVCDALQMSVDDALGRTRPPAETCPCYDLIMEAVDQRIQRAYDSLPRKNLT